MKAVYRTVAALMAVVAFPALYFLKMFHIVAQLGFTEGYFDDQFSLQQIFDFFKDKTDGASGFELSEAMRSTLAPLKPAAIATAVFLAIMLIMLLAVIICSAFTNARKVNLTFSLVGLASTIGAMTAFNSMTSLIVDGTVSLGSIINAAISGGSTLGSIGAFLGIGNLISAVGELKLLRLDSAVIIVIIIFIALALWTASFMLIDLDPYKADEKKINKKSKR